MDKRFTFNEDVMNYEKWRPTYCDELFHDIMEYSKLDRNYSSLGEASLYSMLRNPLNDEKKLNKRREEIEYFKENEEVRFKIMWIFFELGRDKKNSLLI